MYYTQIPEVVTQAAIQKRISPWAAILYGKILGLAREQGHCYGGPAYLAGLMECTERAVRNWLTELEDCGFVIINNDKGNRRCIPCYVVENGTVVPKDGTAVPHIEKPSWNGGSKTRNDGSENVNRGSEIRNGGSTYYNKIIEEDNSTIDNNKTLPPTAERERRSETKQDSEREKKIAESFERFWESYPRKVAKPAALKAYRALCNAPKAEREKLGEGLDKWKAYWIAAKTFPQYIPHPSTFLNQRRFNDTPDPLPNAPKADAGGINWNHKEHDTRKGPLPEPVRKFRVACQVALKLNTDPITHQPLTPEQRDGIQRYLDTGILPPGLDPSGAPPAG